MNSSKKVFYHEIHSIRAFACICVLFVHVTAIYYAMQGEVFNWLTFGLNQVGRFGTPIFAVISGFLLFNQVKKRGFDFKSFVSSRTVKIISPFLIWSLVYLFLNHLFFDIPMFPSFEKVLVDFILQGEAYYHLYFMTMVVQFYLLFPLLQFVRSKKSWIIFLFASAVINYLYLNFHTFGIPIENELLRETFYSKGFVLRWFFFFIFGGFAANFWSEIVTFVRKHKWVFVILGAASVAGAIFEYKIIGSVSSYRVTNFINIPLLVFAGIAVHSLLEKRTLYIKTTTLIGSYSMGVYLIHPLVLFLLMQVVPAEYWATRTLPIIFIVTLVSCILITRLIQFLAVSTFIIPVPRKPKSSDHDIAKIYEKRAAS
ncbi:acyltransferase [Bacillus sp. PAMC26568]|nr:acyltransferase [Bacillus sp. PAMC26568]